MTSRLGKYIAEGKTLDADEREAAALALQHVDANEQEAIDAEWDATIQRRLDEVVNGEVEPVSGQETRAIARARLAAERP